MSEADLRGRFPTIPWREPLRVVTADAEGLACRFCVALYGLAGGDVTRLPQTREEFDAHMGSFHAEEVSDGPDRG